MDNVWIWIVVIAILGSVGFIWYQSAQTPALYVDLRPVNTLASEPESQTATSTATTTSAD